MIQDKIICKCKKVKYGEIKKANKEGATTFEEIKEKTGAGSGCGRCKATIEALIKK
ncbi:MAG: (2Fe-2S)-binding protein [Fusobacteriaceae bacterium]